MKYALVVRHQQPAQSYHTISSAFGAGHRPDPPAAAPVFPVDVPPSSKTTYPDAQHRTPARQVVVRDRPRTAHFRRSSDARAMGSHSSRREELRSDPARRSRSFRPMTWPMPPWSHPRRDTIRSARTWPGAKQIGGCDPRNWRKSSDGQRPCQPLAEERFQGKVQLLGRSTTNEHVKLSLPMPGKIKRPTRGVPGTADRAASEKPDLGKPIGGLTAAA